MLWLLGDQPRGGKGEEDVVPPAQKPQNASFAQRCWKQVGPDFRYASVVLGFSFVLALLLVAYTAPLANEFIFPFDRMVFGQMGTGGASYVRMVVYSLPCLTATIVVPHLILRACVAESAAATYWQRLSMAQTLFFIVLTIVIFILCLDRGISFDVAGAVVNGIVFLIHNPLTFYTIGRALNQSMLRCWIALSLEWLNILVVFYLPMYRTSSAFQWSSPFILCLTSMFNKYAVKQAEWIPPAVTPRLQFMSLVFSGFFTRLSQSFVFHNFWLTIVLELYYAALSLFFKVTLYQRFGFILYLAEKGITHIICLDITALKPPTERAKRVSSLATVFESVFDSACFLYFFVLYFITNPPQNIFLVKAVVLFFVCKAIQVLSDALAAFVIYKYEGIVLFEHATVKKLQPEVFFLLVTLLGCSLSFLPIVGNLWDPNIRLRGI